MQNFAEVHPELLSEWSSENELRPEQVSYGSNKPIIWNGACGHTWTATPKNRGNNHGCPYCSGNKVLVGFNDFESVHPEIAMEWSEKNLPAMPRQFAPSSNKAFWWKCSKCGNEWKARIADRSEGHGCPFCVVFAAEKRKQARRDAKQALLDERRQKRLELSREQQISRDLKDSAFRIAVIRYYSASTGFSVVYDQIGRKIGIPLQFFFPEKCAAIELTSLLNEGWKDWRYENAKNWLCLNSGIKLIRIIPQKGYKFENCKCVRLKNDSAQALNYTLTQVFKRLKIPMDIDVLRDYDKIRRYTEC